MGIRTKVSTNPSMLLGGLKEGVTPLEMAYAYSTIANDGVRVSGDLAPDKTGPVAIQSVEQGDGTIVENHVRKERVFPAKVGQVEKDMLGLVVSSGTGKAAQVGDEFIWGKTGTTENYGDAWFVGGNDDMTVAIWVGYADKLQPMEFEHAGSPVAGGTYPAEIFHDFMTSWLEMRSERRLARHANDPDKDTGVAPALPVGAHGRALLDGAGGAHGDRAHATRAASRVERRRTSSRRNRRRPPSRRPPRPRRPSRRRAAEVAAAERAQAASPRRRAPASPRARASRRAGCPRRRSATAAPPPS